MAEQEAVASVATAALADGDAHGESLLVPLLQGLLGGGDRALAGLGAAGGSVLADVRRALGRLRTALAPPSAHPRAPLLLTLADRLEDALDAADRLDGCRRRPRRHARASRHTVAVTQHDVAAARRLLDDDTSPAELPNDVCADSRLPDANPNVSEPAPEKLPVIPDVPLPEIPVVSVPRPRFLEQRSNPSRRPDHFRHSIAESVPNIDRVPGDPPDDIIDVAPAAKLQYREPRSGIAAIANKFNAQIEREAPPPRRHPIRMAAPKILRPASPLVEPKRIPMYRPLPPTHNFAAAEEPTRASSRFAPRRARMKRANTIDIPKSLGRFDSDTDDDATVPRPTVPKFTPQTDNDRKFLAFMKKNEDDSSGRTDKALGPTNWNDRFGNIKNTFESAGEPRSRSSSNSSAKKFWQSSDEQAFHPPRPAYGQRTSRKSLTEIQNLPSNGVDRPRVPWAVDKHGAATASMNGLPPLVTSVPPPGPTKSILVKPFAAKPIAVNQFSHAPMSAFKPPIKITSPVFAPSHVWSPPSTTLPSPQPESGSVISPRIIPTSPVLAPIPVPWATEETECPNTKALNFENHQSQLASIPIIPPYRERKFIPYGAPAQSHRPIYPQQNFPVKPIPTQNNLAAPELVKKVDNMKSNYNENSDFTPALDAQKLQIEFYEKQIRQKKRSEPLTNGYHSKPPPAPAYTITDYTPHNVVSTFIPLQQTPDIEKAKAHKVDYLPDVVMNENNQFAPPYTPPASQKTPEGPFPPKTKIPVSYQNGNHNGDESLATLTPDSPEPTEHQSVTRVMRGPVSQQATITTGVRTRQDDHLRGSSAAKSLKGVLQKFSAPRRDLPHIDHSKRNGTVRPQVRPEPAPPVNMIPNGYSPSPQASPQASSPTTRPVPVIKYNVSKSPGLLAESPNSGRFGFGTSKESIYSSDSVERLDSRSAGSKPSSPIARYSRTPSPGALSKSESWHQIADRSVTSSPRKIVSRTKSMHLLSVPKLFEGGIAKSEISEKTRTVEAYFTGKASPSTRRRPGGFALGRSRTMPAVTEHQFLDESNADDAFEDLVSALA